MYKGIYLYDIDFNLVIMVIVAYKLITFDFIDSNIHKIYNVASGDVS